MVRKIYMYICTYVSHPRANAYVRMRILLETSQDTVYLRPDHCCYRSRVVRVETDMETWLVRFIYRTPFRKKGTVMDSTAPIYLVWILIEDSLKWEYTLPTLHSSCTLRTSWFCSKHSIQDAICIYIYVYVYMYICIYTYVHIQTYICISRTARFARYTTSGTWVVCMSLGWIFNQFLNQIYWDRGIHNCSFLSRRCSIYKTN